MIVLRDSEICQRLQCTNNRIDDGGHAGCTLKPCPKNHKENAGQACPVPKNCPYRTVHIVSGQWNYKDHAHTNMWLQDRHTCDLCYKGKFDEPDKNTEKNG